MQPASQDIHQSRGMEEKKVTNQSRKERLKGDDAFIHAADEAQQWLGKHRAMAVGALAVIAVLVAGGLITNQLHHRRDVQAAEQFAQGFRALDGRLTDAKSEAKRAEAKAAAKKARAQAAKGSEDAAEQSELDDAFEDDPEQLTFASESARWQAAKEAFAKAEATRGHEGVGALAALLAADLEAKLGEHEQAEKHFDALRRDLKGDERLLFLAVERYAYMREAQGDLDGALKALTELTDAHKNFYADRATLHKARIYEAQGDGPRAVALLESMQQNFPRTTLGEEIALRLEALGDATAQAPAAGPVQGQAESPKDRP